MIKMYMVQQGGGNRAVNLSIELRACITPSLGPLEVLINYITQLGEGVGGSIRLGYKARA